MNCILQVEDDDEDEQDRETKKGLSEAVRKGDADDDEELEHFREMRDQVSVSMDLNSILTLI